MCLCATEKLIFLIYTLTILTSILKILTIYAKKIDHLRQIKSFTPHINQKTIISLLNLKILLLAVQSLVQENAD